MNGPTSQAAAHQKAEGSPHGMEDCVCRAGREGAVKSAAAHLAWRGFEEDWLHQQPKLRFAFSCRPCRHAAKQSRLKSDAEHDRESREARWLMREVCGNGGVMWVECMVASSSQHTCCHRGWNRVEPVLLVFGRSVPLPSGASGVWAGVAAGVQAGGGGHAGGKQRMDATVHACRESWRCHAISRVRKTVRSPFAYF